MTFEEAKEIFLNRGWIKVEGGTYFEGDKWREAVMVISDYLQKEPCNDAISRKAVLEYIEGNEADLWHKSENELVCQDIKELPPVTPQPKIGYWIKEKSVQGWDGNSYQCSECGRSIHIDSEVENLSDYPYCHCGSKMIDPQEGEINE